MPNQGTPDSNRATNVLSRPSVDRPSLADHRLIRFEENIDGGERVVHGLHCRPLNCNSQFPGGPEVRPGTLV